MTVPRLSVNAGGRVLKTISINAERRTLHLDREGVEAILLHLDLPADYWREMAAIAQRDDEMAAMILDEACDDPCDAWGDAEHRRLIAAALVHEAMRPGSIRSFNKGNNRG